MCMYLEVCVVCTATGLLSADGVAQANTGLRREAGLARWAAASATDAGSGRGGSDCEAGKGGDGSDEDGELHFDGRFLKELGGLFEVCW